MNEHKSIVFSWRHEDFKNLLKSCDNDDEVQISLDYLHDKNAKILEAGCGLGRVVKYLHDKGFTHVSGIELNTDAVTYLNSYFPELDIIQGDILNLPYPKESFDVVLSYGVIEHFQQGPQEPLLALYHVLKPGGMAIITVPSFNIVRRISYFLRFFDIRKYPAIRKFFGKKPLVRNKKRFSYYIDPQIGDFFEYRFTPHQFEKLCTKAGFSIVASKPIAHIDGLFHSFGPPLVYFKDWSFSLSWLGNALNKLFSLIPFFHNHMHLCVLKKEQQHE